MVFQHQVHDEPEHQQKGGGDDDEFGVHQLHDAGFVLHHIFG